jgi:hypothetical protein
MQWVGDRVEVIGVDKATCVAVTESQVNVQGRSAELQDLSNDEKAGDEPGLHEQEVVGAEDNESIVKKEDSNQDWRRAIAEYIRASSTRSSIFRPYNLI